MMGDAKCRPGGEGGRQSAVHETRRRVTMRCRGAHAADKVA